METNSNPVTPLLIDLPLENNRRCCRENTVAGHVASRTEKHGYPAAPAPPAGGNNNRQWTMGHAEQPDSPPVSRLP
ncbi:unnamed protein product [[Candida] boidinii]|uniref:Unnamed protein product n=1 Tax=Candida boidinii TaxID=5477 RepID=A0ACB5U9M2_CANBO|nr:unnamed protein product [[Candida] boidinii]